MIVLTGGAGFIGSAYLRKLNDEGIKDIIVVDHLDATDKWKNLQGKKFLDYFQKDDFLALVASGDAPRPKQVIHIGACSSTTETDGAYFIKNNYEYSKTLAEWAIENKAYFMYASSAATYGDGKEGYSDDVKKIPELKPLNMYGYSKQLFDLWVINNGLYNKVTGLKFFNVFGPNEYHKGDMMSVICKAFPQIQAEGKMRLFKSYKSEYPAGGQMRDFVYVKDVIDVMYWLMKHPGKSGIFNLGTGKARSWNDLANAIFRAMGKTPQIEYIDMPDHLKPKYQYFTEADMSKLAKAGCRHKFMTLEESVKDYAGYLKDGARL
jgi:ADP-L-glycero-D-manno-heptose 6-epimerase